LGEKSVRNIEKICVAITICCVSALAHFAAAAEPLRVALLIGEDEYQARETVPAFAEQFLKPLGIESIAIHADPKKPNHFPGIEQLDSADLLVIYVRRRPMPADEMAHVRKFLADGKPVVGIRTACHAFASRAGVKGTGEKFDEWPDFDVQVLGGHYTNHFMNKDGTDVSVLPVAKDNPILAGIGATSFHSDGTLYKCGELDNKTVLLMNGTTTDQGKGVTQPVAWTHEFGRSRVFFTSLGHPDDFKQPAFNKMLVNAILWAANRSPSEAAK
jgi:type 1 glutamine amidotransferase